MQVKDRRLDKGGGLIEAEKVTNVLVGGRPRLKSQTILKKEKTRRITHVR